MIQFAKISLLSAAIAAAAVTIASPAVADEYYRRHRNNDALVLGAVGLAAGVIAGTAIASQPRYVERRYVERRYVEPAPIYDDREPAYIDDYPPPPPPRRARTYVAYDLEPWTPEWYRFCSDRYRSFNSRTGTYTGYDGMSHFCTAG